MGRSLTHANPCHPRASDPMNAGNPVSDARPAPVAVVALLLPLAVFLPLSINVHVSPELYWYDQQRIGQVAVLVAMAALVATRLARSGPSVTFGRPAPPVLLGGFLFLALGGLSAIHAAQVPDAFLEWSRFALIGLLAWTVSSCARSFPGPVSLALLASLALGCLWFAGARLGPYAAILALHLPLSATDFLDGFDNPRFFGQLQTMTLPLLMVPLILPRVSMRWRVAASAGLVGWWMLAWLSGTRGTFYALLATAVAAALVFGPRGRAYAMASAGFAAAGALGYLFFFVSLPGWLGMSMEGATFERSAFHLSSREALWWLAIEYIVRHPLLGVGPMHFAAAGSAIGAHPHSLPLQIAAEWGLPAASLVLVGIATAVVKRASSLRRLLLDGTGDADAQLDMLLLIAITAALIQGLVDGVLVVPYTETVLAMLVGLAWGRALRGQAPVPLGTSVRTCVVLGLCVCASVLTAGTWTQAQQLAERISVQEARPGLLLPRFWSAGWIGPAARQ